MDQNGPPRHHPGQRLKARTGPLTGSPPKPKLLPRLVLDRPGECVFVIAPLAAKPRPGNAFIYGDLASEATYIESDPIELAGGQLTTYGYVDNNPISNIDPRGTGPVGAVIGGILGGVGGFIGGTAVGAGGGTLVAPGVGTVAGGGEGAYVGTVGGVVAGAAIGDRVGDWLDSLLFSKNPFTGRPGSELLALVPRVVRSRPADMVLMDIQRRIQIGITITVKASLMFTTGIAHQTVAHPPIPIGGRAATAAG